MTMIKNLFLLCLLLVCLTGCVTTQGGRSYLPPDFTNEEFSGMAAEISTVLSGVYPAGQTSLSLEPLTTPFHQALDNALRGKGFKIFETGPEMPHKDVLALTYVIDHVSGENGIYVQIRLSDGFIFSRYYTATDKGYMPGVPLQGTKQGATNG